MLPKTWIPWRRPSDDEVVGYLAPCGPDLFLPYTLIGTLLAEALSLEEAQNLLEQEGLTRLAGRWWCPLPPHALPPSFTVEQPNPHWERRPIRIVEVSPERCTARLEYPELHEQTSEIILPLPAGHLLTA